MRTRESPMAEHEVAATFISRSFRACSASENPPSVCAAATASSSPTCPSRPGSDPTNEIAAGIITAGTAAAAAAACPVCSSPIGGAAVGGDFSRPSSRPIAPPPPAAGKTEQLSKGQGESTRTRRCQ